MTTRIIRAEEKEDHIYICWSLFLQVLVQPEPALEKHVRTYLSNLVNTMKMKFDSRSYKRPTNKQLSTTPLSSVALPVPVKLILCFHCSNNLHVVCKMHLCCSVIYTVSCSRSGSVKISRMHSNDQIQAWTFDIVEMKLSNPQDATAMPLNASR